MFVEDSISINGSRNAVWTAITDIENATKTISGIEEIVVLRKPAHGLVGLTWNETRVLFGKQATVELEIVEAVENEYYRTRAQSDGFEFITTMRVVDGAAGCTLISSHDSRPLTLAARLKGLPMVFFKGYARRAIMQDLNDIKAAVETSHAVVEE